MMRKKILIVFLLLFVIQTSLTTCGPCIPQIYSFDVTSIDLDCRDYFLKSIPDSATVNVDSVTLECLMNGKEYTRDKYACVNWGSSLFATTTCHDYEDVNEGLVNKIDAIEISCDKDIWGVKAGTPLDSTMYRIRSFAFLGDTLSNSELKSLYNNSGIVIDKYGKGYGHSYFHISFLRGFENGVFASFQVLVRFVNGEKLHKETRRINIKK